MGGWVNGVWTWGNCKINPLVLSEPSLASDFESLRIILDGRGPYSEEGDGVVWRAESDGVFSVASCYNFYAGSRISYGPFNKYDEVLGFMWKAEILFKIKTFSWRLLVNRLPSNDF